MVNWDRNGKDDFMAKAFGLVVNMETMAAKDFEKGLTQLKALFKSKTSESKASESKAFGSNAKK